MRAKDLPPLLVLLGLVAVGAPGAEMPAFSGFRRYTEHDPSVPVYIVPSERTLHRFFDTSPISPSGRFLALFRLPYENRSPAPGDAGEVVVIDLQSGKERLIAQSRGWEMQVGANVQWGRTDSELYFNDVDPRTWKAFAVQLDPATGKRREFDGTVFMVAPDGSALVSHNLIKSRLAQEGYGVIIPGERVTKNIGPVNDDGLYVTDTKTGQCRLLVSLKTIYEQAVPSIRIEDPDKHEFYCFQAKWNPQSSRLLTAVQWRPLTGGKRHRAVITMNRDGSDIRTAVTAAQWDLGGHHINWSPDGVHLSMNLSVDEDPGLEIASFKFDGSGLQSIFKPGSGHPSFHPDGRFIISDAYPSESVAFHDGSVPLRLIDTRRGNCTNIVRIFVSAVKGEFRVDPHPAWHAGRYVVFNGFTGGTRKVYIADLGEVLNKASHEK